MSLNSDLLAALLFIGFGLGFATIGWGYGVGTPSALGAGAMPVLAGGGLCLLGLVQLGRTAVALRAGRKLASAFVRAELRPLLLVLGAVLAFGLLITPLGFLPALAALVGIAWFAEAGGRWWELPAVMLAVVVLIVAIFYFGLGIPFRLVAWNF